MNSFINVFLVPSVYLTCFLARWINQEMHWTQTLNSASSSLTYQPLMIMMPWHAERLKKHKSPVISKPRDFHGSQFSAWFSGIDVIIITYSTLHGENFLISTNIFQPNDFTISKCGWILNILIIDSLKLKESLTGSCSVGVWSGHTNQETVGAGAAAAFSP